MSLFSVLGLKLSLLDARDKNAQLSSKFGPAQPVEVFCFPELTLRSLSPGRKGRSWAWVVEIVQS